jgi:hypothetical protein
MIIEDFLNCQPLKRAKLLAGTKGIKRQFSWCVPDSFTNIDKEIWVLPNLLLIYVGRSSSESWDRYLDRILQMGVSGVVFIGKDLDSLGIPPDILERCDQARIPLIWVPINHSVTAFVKRIFPYLTVAASGEYYRETWLKSLCYSDEEIYDSVIAESYGYSKDCRYYCLVLRLKHPEGLDVMEIERCLGMAYEYISADMSLKKAEVLAFGDGQTLICFVPFLKSTSKQYAKEYINKVAIGVRSISNHKWRIGVGASVASIEDFGESFRGAMRTIGLVERLRVHEKVSFYEDWHMHMMLLRGPESELSDFMMQELEPIVNNEELLSTITEYLTFGEKMKITAENLYIHINTLKYRLDRISELLGCDLRNATTRFRLRMAITIHRYLTG